MRIITYACMLCCILFQLPLFAQSISGPSVVCPNVPVRFTFKPTSTADCSFTFQGVTGPDNVYVAAQSGNTIDYVFPAHKVAAVYRLSVGYACGSVADVAAMNVTVNTVGYGTGTTRDVPCVSRGNQTFFFDMGAMEGTPTWSNNAGWPIAGGPSTTQGKETSITYNINNSIAGVVSVVVNNTLCPGSQANSETYTITRSLSTLAAPVFTAKPLNICTNSTAVFAVSPVDNATSYVWTASNAGVLINGQASPLTVSAANGGNSVTLSAGATTSTGGMVTVTAQTDCGQTPAASAGLTVGPVGIVISGPANVISKPVSFVANPAITGATYTWYPGGTIISGAGTNSIFVQFYIDEVAYTTQVAVDVSGSTATCGTKIHATKTVNVKGHTLFAVSPSPASNILNVSVPSVISEMAAKTSKSTEISEIMIIDKLNNIKKIIKFPAGTKNTTINVSNLPADMYILRIRNIDEWSSQPIIVGGH
ncbi:MAG: hypothetical protein ACJ751_25975 [Niastella sp.]|uniref:hypothetical protein n=1 Tax=Niastella sp. TaxID=1869183 RepID=UPI003899ECB1